MNPGIQSLWIILTVMVPGLVFYGTFRITQSILKIDIPFITTIEQSETVSICALFSIMFIIQSIGIATESIAEIIGPYRHKDKGLQKAFDKRYIIISKLNPDKDYHVERIVSQFFMSHNIAIGMIINFIWVFIYEIIIVKTVDPNIIGIILIITVITSLSIFVAINRFYQASKVLYAHIHKLNE